MTKPDPQAKARLESKAKKAFELGKRRHQKGQHQLAVEALTDSAKMFADVYRLDPTLSTRSNLAAPLFAPV